MFLRTAKNIIVDARIKQTKHVIFVVSIFAMALTKYNVLMTRIFNH